MEAVDPMVYHYYKKLDGRTLENAPNVEHIVVVLVAEHLKDFAKKLIIFTKILYNINLRIKIL